MKAVASERWFAVPPITGLWALAWGILAVTTPVLIGGSLDDLVSGVALVLFAPFIILSALFLAWKLAGAVALASAIAADALFIGPPNQLLEGPSDVIGMVAFLTASVLVIAMIEGARRAIAKGKAPVRLSGGDPDGIVFSLENGQVWASWYGRETSVHLGPQEEVAGMMEDFLAQVELGKRFAGKTLWRSS